MMKNLLLAAAAIPFCIAASAQNSPWFCRVLEYVPAPGQFVNIIPEFEEGDSYEAILEKATGEICGDKNPGMISLGAFGGYVVVAFDHPVANVAGDYDFKIYGNALISDRDNRGGSAEPGIVMVSEDVNKNGLPDDPWYELAGSEFNNSGAQKGFTITYFRPDPDRAVNADPDPDDKAITDRTYIRYTTNRPGRETGYVQRNSFHTQSYWPEWVDAESLEFAGTRLPDNYVNLGSGDEDYFVSRYYDYGYADNLPNNEDLGFKLEWAVNPDGTPANIRGAHFIKIYTAVNQECGWIGESSTEITGGEDLHPDAVYTPDSGVKDIVTDEARVVVVGVRNGSLIVRSTLDTAAEIYSIDGRKAADMTLFQGENRLDISALPKGVYLLCAPRTAAKFLR